MTNITSVVEKQAKAFETIAGDLGITNVMSTPKLDKIVVSTGIGRIQDKKKIELIIDRIARITGQKPAARKAKKSIAAFKVREGDVVGYQVTLRGARMSDFMDKLVNIALPRTRDFRGLDAKAIDDMGNMTIGVKEHTIFPSCSDEELVNVFGMSITIVTTASDKKTAETYLRYLGVPLRKENQED